MEPLSLITNTNNITNLVTPTKNPESTPAALELTPAQEPVIPPFPYGDLEALMGALTLGSQNASDLSVKERALMLKRLEATLKLIKKVQSALTQASKNLINLNLEESLSKPVEAKNIDSIKQEYRQNKPPHEIPA